MTHTLTVGGIDIAYTHDHGVTPQAPGVFFLPGFRSHRQGEKAQHLRELASSHGWAFSAVDYSGHGDSAGSFESGHIARWSEEAAAVLAAVHHDGATALVGSSMGAWIAVLVAKALPGHVQAVVTVAAAPDFTEDLLLPSLSATDREALASGDTVLRPSQYGDGPYPISPQLITGSRDALVLRETLPLTCPLRALHGAQDPDVPVAQSQKLLDAWAGSDKSLEVIADGDHRLSRQSDLSTLSTTVLALID